MSENRQNEKKGRLIPSEWVKVVGSLILILIGKLRRSTSTKETSVFKDHEVA